MNNKNKLHKLNSSLNILLWGLGTLLVYYVLFSNQHLLMVTQKNDISAKYSMVITLVAALFYGNAVSFIVKNTVERAITYQRTEERSS